MKCTNLPSLGTVICLAAILVAPRVLATATNVFHERTGNDVTSGNPNTCGGLQAYVPTLNPSSAQAYLLRFKVEFQGLTDTLNVYYTTDGTAPSGTLGVPSGTTMVISGNYQCTFTSGADTVDVCNATIPAQPAGTVVKYIISARHSGGGPEIFANGGTCETAACATVFQYVVGLLWDSDANAANNDPVTGTGLGGTGAWDNLTSANWYNGTTEIQWDDTTFNGTVDVTFPGTAGTVMLDSGRSVRSMNFKVGGYLLVGSTLTLNTVGPITTSSGVTTLGSLLAGTVGYSKTGPGTLLLTNEGNTITGPVTVSDGILQLTTSGTIGGTLAGSGDVTLNGGTLRNSDPTNGNTFLTANRSILVGANGGTVDATVSGVASIYNGIISGAANTLAKTGPGNLILGGNSDNSFSGALTISSGTLTAAKNNALGTSAGATTVDSGGALGFQGGITYSTVEPVNIAGTGADTAGAINNLSGNNSFAGPITLTANSSIGSASGTLTLAGNIAGAFDLTKVGPGTVALNGNNLHINTFVNAGTLKLNNAGAAGTGTITIGSAGTLSGSVAVPNPIIVSGTVSPGASPGTLSSGSETWNGGGSYVWEINDATGTQGADPGYDFLNISGTLTIGATPATRFIINITSLTVGNTPGNAANFDNTQDYTWNIATASAGIIGFDATKFSVIATNFTNPLTTNGSFRVAQNGNNVEVRHVHSPIIATQPVNQSAECGTGTALFSVGASGTPTLAYHWRKGGVDLVNGGSYSGVTTAALSVNPTTSTTSGNYDVVITNNYGSVTSTLASLTLSDTVAPTITCPTPILVSANPGHCGSNVIFTVTATDACDASPSVVSTPASGSAFPVGTTTVTNIATDAAGNSNSCTFTVTVVDTTAPILTCPPNLTVQCGQSLDPTNTGTATATDNCDTNVVVTHVDHGPIEVTGSSLNGWAFSTTDGGTPPNTATSELVNGPGLPPLGTGSAHLAVGTNGNAAAQLRSTNYNGLPLSSLTELRYMTYRTVDGSGGQGVYVVLDVDLNGDGTTDDFLFFEPEYQRGTYNPSLPIQGPLQTGVWQAWNALVGGWWSANSLAGLTPGAGVKTLATYLATFPTARLGTNTAGAVRLVAGFGAGAWDNFDGNADQFTIGFNGLSAIYDFDLTPGNLCQNTIIARAWTATDSNTNSASCTQEIRIVDTTPPIITCSTNITVSTHAGQCGAIVNFIVTATDACDVTPALVSTPTNGSFFAVGTTTVTNVATDACGNTTNCTFTVTVIDTEPPVITCPTNIVVGNTPGQCSAIVNFTTTATDNCSVTNLHSTPPSGSVFPIGTTTVTNVATDASGNTSTCTFTVKVNDTEAPVITCSSNIVVTCASPSGTPVTFTSTTTDNCTNVTVVSTPASGSAFPVGTTTVTNIATDAAGNSNSCTFTVTVVDTTAPILTCPPNLTVQCGQSLDPTNTGTATATDNCDTNVVVTHVDHGPIEVTGSSLNGWAFSTTDGGTPPNTATSELVNGPGLPPLGTGSAHLAVGTNGNAAAQLRSTNYNGLPLSSLTELRYMTYRTVDGSGGQGVYVVLDVDLNGDGTTDDFLFFEPEYQRGTYNPSLPIQGPLQTGVWQAWNALVGGWWSANSLAGLTPGAGVKTLATYLATFPTARLGTNTAGAVRLVAGFGAGAWDNFDGNADQFTIGFNGLSAIYDFDLTPGNLCQNTIIARAWTATDSNTNSASCTQEIRIVDTTPPIITCSTNITVSTHAGQCGAIVNFIVTATDACDVTPALVSTPTNGSFFAVGTTTVTNVATDACGNTTNCTFTVTVIDTEPPVITCPTNLTVAADAGACSATNVNLGVPITSDNCGVASITNNAPAVYLVGTTPVVWSVSDAHGNTTICTQMVTVIDTQAPVITCPTNLIVNANSGSCSATNVNLGVPTTSDNCGVASITNNAPAVYLVGTTPVVWSAADAHGHTTTCTQLVTVVDNQAPVISCSTNRIVEASSPAGTPVFFSTTATDNCSSVSIFCSASSGDLFPLGITTVNCAAYDSSLNASVCFFNVTVMDTNPPAINCPTNLLVGCNRTNGAIVEFTVTATDLADSNVIVTANPPSGSTFPLGTNTVLVTAADHSGNTNTCTFTVTVVESPILLSISHQGATVILSWPVTCAIYELQETPSLSPPITWTPSVPPVVSNFQNLVTVPHGPTNRFFRLQSP